MPAFLQRFLLLLTLVLCVPLCSNADEWQDLYSELKVQYKARQFDSAIVVGLKAAESCGMSLGENDTTVAKILHKVGASYQQIGDHRSKDVYEKALKIWEAHPDLQGLSYAKTLSNLGTVYNELGLPVDAEFSLKRALKIKRGLIPVDSLSIASTLNNLSNAYIASGRYVEAEEYELKCLRIRTAILDSLHPKVYAAFGILSTIYYQMSQFDKSERFADIAIRLSRRSGGGPSQVTLNKGMAKVARGEYEEARAYFRTFIDTVLNQESADSSFLALYFNNLGLSERKLGLLESASSNLKIARRLANRNAHLSSQSQLMITINRAEVELLLGNVALANSIYSTDGERYIDLAGRRSPEVARVLRGRAEIARIKGNYKASLEYSSDAVEIYERFFSEVAFVLSESDALRFSSSYGKTTDQFVGIFLEANQPEEYLNRAVEIALLTKGAISDIMFARKESMREGDDPGVGRMMSEFKLAKYRLAQAYSFASSEGNPKEYEKSIDSLADYVRSLESKLIESGQQASRENIFHPTLSDINSSLDGRTLVEYIRLQPLKSIEVDTTEKYVAIITKPNGSSKFIRIGSAFEIDAEVSRYRRHMKRVSQSKRAPSRVDLKEYGEIASDLYDKIWLPVAGYVENKSKLVISPDGSLNLVSFGSLVDEKGKYLLEEYSIHYLSAGRDLMRLKKKKTSGTGLFVLGNPDFNAPYESRIEEPVRIASRSYAAVNDNDLRGADAGCWNLSTASFEPVRYSERELDRIIDAWKSSDNDEIKACNQNSASEYNFKKYAPGSRVIHLTTHGYVIKAECVNEADMSVLKRNPLMFSGLVLAGANLHGADADSLGIDDGLLLAEEVASLDLTGTELVVLSACETGLGQIEDGEGVFGLRRAFEMAGVRTIISSLWPVNDRVTARLMIELYSGSEEGIPERLRRASLAQYKRLIGKGDAPHPILWAGFISQGAWR